MAKTVVKEWAVSDTAQPETRTAAIATLAWNGDDTLFEMVKSTLVQSLNDNPKDALARECARTLTTAAPERLLEVSHPLVDDRLVGSRLEHGRIGVHDHITYPISATYRTGSAGSTILATSGEIRSSDGHTRDTGSAETQGAETRQSRRRRPKQKRATVFVTAEIAEVMKWFIENCGGDDGPAAALDESRLIKIWEASKGCSYVEAVAYRVIAVFCQLLGKSFPIAKREWGEVLPSGEHQRATLDGIFERGLAAFREVVCIRQDPSCSQPAEKP